MEMLFSIIFRITNCFFRLFLIFCVVFRDFVKKKNNYFKIFLNNINPKYYYLRIWKINSYVVLVLNSWNEV